MSEEASIGFDGFYRNHFLKARFSLCFKKWSCFHFLSIKLLSFSEQNPASAFLLLPFFFFFLFFIIFWFIITLKADKSHFFLHFELVYGGNTLFL